MWNNKIKRYALLGLLGLCTVYIYSCQREIELDGRGLSIREAVYTSGGNYMGFSLAQNATLQLTPVLTPGNVTTSEVIYSNRHPDVITVNSTGLVTGIAVGIDTLLITSTQYPELSVSYVVNVTAN